MKQTNQNSVSMSMGRYEPHTAKSTTLKINLEASFTPVVHNEGIIGIDHQNVYARKLASPVLHIARDYEG